MIIKVPVAAYHEYNTAIYVASALRQLGHDAEVITQATYYEELPEVDLFFGVDSAGPLFFPPMHRAKTCMWFIDSRHNCNPGLRVPDDDTNAQTLADGGGWVFQAQRRDWLRNVESATVRSSWLPLAADPDVWEPKGTERTIDVGFGGNVWCETRGKTLEAIKARHTLGQWTGTPEQLAQGYGRSKVGFNISTRYDGPVAYDINMRVFEVMACGLPLVTNELPEMRILGFAYDWHYMGFENIPTGLHKIGEVLRWPEQKRLEMGARARKLIVDAHTYKHRMINALEVLAEVGIIKEDTTT